MVPAGGACWRCTLVEVEFELAAAEGVPAWGEHWSTAYSGFSTGCAFSGLQWPTVVYGGLQWPTVVYSGLRLPTVAYGGQR